MKHMRKILALALALMLVLGLATTVSAANETYKITIPAGDTHKYEIYQIFTGDYHEEDAQRVLSNIVWGDNGTGTADEKVSDEVLNALAAATGSDKEKLAVISQYVDLESEAHQTITGGETDNSVSVVPGYYLIKDVDDSVTGDDAYTTYIVKVVDNVTVARKTAKPEVDKQVKDEVNDAEAGSVDGWGETADHAINESFQFKLIAKLPVDTDFDAYKTYKVVFNDTMSEGVTFESIASVKVNGTDVTNYICSATVGQAGGSWTLTIADIMKYDTDLTDGAVIEVIYNAHLNEKAAIGNVVTNKNTVYLQYSNNPNAGGEGDLGKTTEDTVWVFTYEIDSVKYADEATAGKELAGAGFTLYSSTDGTTKGEAVKLIFDEIDEVYRPAPAGATESVVTEMTSAADGKFNVAGLDVGTYILEETKVPAGYNKCVDIVIAITAEHKELNAENAETVIKFNGEDPAVNNVINKSGAVLPETGGMGTTLFYIIGGVLALAAVVLLVTKKRMASAE